MKRNKIIALVVFLILFFVSATLFGRKVRSFAFSETNSTSGLLSSAAMKFEKKFHFLFYLSDLQKENKDLSDKLASLQVDRSKIEELQHENDLLKKELGFIQANQTEKMIPAKIIGREPTSNSDYITVDKGKIDGVRLNAAVISNGTLIGQVKATYDHNCKIVLITSKDSNILAMLQESRAEGLLRGGIAGLVLEDIVQDVNVKSGEYVITSGLDGDIPEGILIGKTDKLTSSSSDLFKKVSVEPIEDLSKLEMVFILK